MSTEEEPQQPQQPHAKGNLREGSTLGKKRKKKKRSKKSIRSQISHHILRPIKMIALKEYILGALLEIYYLRP